MEILVRRNDLVKELQLVQGIVERKNSIPILSNVLVEARSGEILISATDLDVSLRCGCPAQVVAEGAVTLGAKKLYEIARSLPESDVSLKVEEDAWARIKCERVDFKMAGLPREDFPSLPDGKGGRAVEVPAALLRGLIQRTSFAITAEDARYYLAGALLVLDKDGASMVATDGHRLAWAQKKAPLKLADVVRVLVPRKAIAELPRLVEDLGGEESVSFQQGEGHIIFAAGGRTLASKMVEAQFPAYEKVVAVTGDKKVTVGREPLQSAIRRVSLLSSERGRAVRICLEEGRVEVSASSPELGEARESLPIEYAGDTVEIGFNAQYLLDFLGVVGTEAVALEVKDAESQGLLRPVGEDGGDYRYVVMPMRF
ncbi:MAG TPA: DNA polymerase III subunit beta [Vicinamibacteria bacterium]|nr:DNA polymerase III subunit beta [Vicinamibacteria bacterium]